MPYCSTSKIEVISKHLNRRTATITMLVPKIIICRLKILNYHENKNIYPKYYNNKHNTVVVLITVHNYLKIQLLFIE